MPFTACEAKDTHKLIFTTFLTTSPLYTSQPSLSFFSSTVNEASFT